MQPQESSFQPASWLSQSDVFIRGTFSRANKSQAVIAVSGGIDSAVALSLLVRALGPDSVVGVCLPYGLQNMTDAHQVMDHVGLPTTSQFTHDIQPIVSAAASMFGLKLQPEDQLSKTRLGNLMARSRMMAVFDLAKKLDALVCGTENKSEHYLGYFTRFGDAASDLEPIAQLYKTQVRQLAVELGLPEIFLTKSPSAGLWVGQTDETEMGFSYQDADLVLTELIDAKTPSSDIAQKINLPTEVVTKVITQVEQSAFKLQVPYTPN